MEKELVTLVIEKEYGELSPSERVSLREWCSSEEEFEQLKSVMKGVEQMRLTRQYAPKPETKNSLDALFAQKHAKVPPVIWYNSILVALYPKDKPMAQRPIMQLAAVALLLLMVYPLLFDQSAVKQKDKIVKIDDFEKNEQFKISKEAEVKSDSVVGDEQQQVMSPNEIQPVATVVVEDFDMSAVSANTNTNSVTLTTASAGTTFSWTTEPVASDHPDGIFIGESAVSYSQPASSEPAVFDLLTATF